MKKKVMCLAFVAILAFSSLASAEDLRDVGHLAVLSDGETEEDLRVIMNKYAEIAPYHVNSGGQGIYFFDFCEPFKAIFGSNEDYLYIDDDGTVGALDCDDGSAPRLFFDALAGMFGSAHIAKINDGNGIGPYGAMYEAEGVPPVCASCSTGSYIIPPGSSTMYCIEFNTYTNVDEARVACEGLAGEVWSLATITDTETKAIIQEIITGYQNSGCMTDYGVGPQGLFVSDECRDVMISYLGDPGSGQVFTDADIFGYDNYDTIPEAGQLVCDQDNNCVVFNSWTDNIPSGISQGKLEETLCSGLTSPNLLAALCETPLPECAANTVDDCYPGLCEDDVKQCSINGTECACLEQTCDSQSAPAQCVAGTCADSTKECGLFGDNCGCSDCASIDPNVAACSTADCDNPDYECALVTSGGGVQSCGCRPTEYDCGEDDPTCTKSCPESSPDCTDSSLGCYCSNSCDDSTWDEGCESDACDSLGQDCTRFSVNGNDYCDCNLGSCEGSAPVCGGTCPPEAPNCASITGPAGIECYCTDNPDPCSERSYGSCEGGQCPDDLDCQEYSNGVVQECRCGDTECNDNVVQACTPDNCDPGYDCVFDPASPTACVCEANGCVSQTPGVISPFCAIDDCDPDETCSFQSGNCVCIPTNPNGCRQISLPGESFACGGDCWEGSCQILQSADGSLSCQCQSGDCSGSATPTCSGSCNIGSCTFDSDVSSNCFCKTSPQETCGDGITTGAEDCDIGKADPDSDCPINKECEGNCRCDVSGDYDGEFSPPFSATGETAKFDIEFTDISTVPPSLKPVSWKVDYIGSIGDCLLNTPNVRFDVPDTRDYPTGVPIYLGELFLVALEQSYCLATMEAVVQAAGSHEVVEQSYILDTRPLPKLCPTCEIPELPAIIHSHGIYSSSVTEAQKNYDSASVVVSTLITLCGEDTNCPTKPEAKVPLDDARIHLSAANRYLEGCATGGSLCRLSNYYSTRARELASQGISLI